MFAHSYNALNVLGLMSFNVQPYSTNLLSLPGGRCIQHRFWLHRRSTWSWSTWRVVSCTIDCSSTGCTKRSSSRSLDSILWGWKRLYRSLTVLAARYRGPLFDWKTYSDDLGLVIDKRCFTCCRRWLQRRPSKCCWLWEPWNAASLTVLLEIPVIWAPVGECYCVCFLCSFKFQGSTVTVSLLFFLSFRSSFFNWIASGQWFTWTPVILDLYPQ